MSIREEWTAYFDIHRIEETERGVQCFPEPDKDQSVLICHHGAGYSALSFAMLTKELLCLQSDLAVISFDCRAHGQSNGDEADLSLDNLVEDFSQVINAQIQQWTAPHTIFLAGHSLGGSIITRVAAQRKLCQDPAGIVVIDIVEEAALRALTNMPRILAARPATFASAEDAIRWSLARKLCLNQEAAYISIPDQLKRVCDDPSRLTWRADLLKSKAHWEGWFRGLSTAFVSCEIPRLLVLAEREYLDRPLMIASMQGKFQCSVIRDTGHAIQEDRPDELAKIIISFIQRNLLVARLNRRRLELHR